MIKVDFEVVARECGYSNPRSASNRLYAMKKSSATTAGTDTTAGTTSDDKPTVIVSRNTKVTKRKPVPQKGDRVSGLMAQPQDGIESMDCDSNGRQEQEEQLEEGEIKQEEQGTEIEANEKKGIRGMKNKKGKKEGK